MKVYRIERNKKKAVTATVNGQPLRQIFYHSRVQLFDFGNASRESQDLALSILADFYEEQPTPEQLHLGEGRAWSYHQKFTWHFIAHETEDVFTIGEEAILQWLVEREEK